MTKELVYFFIPMMLVQLVALSNNISDRFFLMAYVSVSDVGTYSKVYLIGSSLGMLFDGFSILWSPYVVKHKCRYVSELHPIVVKLFKLVMLFALIMLILAIWTLTPGMAIRNVIDSKTLTVGIFIISAFFVRMGYQLFVPVLSAFDKTATILRISLTSGGIGLALNAILIPNLGILGAAVATWVSFFIYSTFTMIAVLRVKRTTRCL